jgi:hypothetical protein
VEDRRLDEFFEAYYRRHPVSATFIGVHEWDAVLDPSPLPSYPPLGDDQPAVPVPASPSGEMLATGPRLETKDLDLTLARSQIEIEEWEESSRHFRHGNPCHYTGEAVFGVLSLLLRNVAPLPRRVDSAIGRLEATPAFLETARREIREAPLLWTERAVEECDGALAFLTEGLTILRAEVEIESPAFDAAAARAAEAFADFRTYLTDELAAHPTDGYSAGSEALDLMIRRAHFLDHNAEHIERYALDVLAETEAYLREHAADFGANTPQEALAGLADLHPPTEEYYGRFGEVWEQVRAIAEEQALLTWPYYPIRYVPQPRWARSAAPHLYFLFYRASAAFGPDGAPSTPVAKDARPFEYLVTPIEPDMPREEQLRRLRATNDSVIKLNHVVHHGSIGHHVQNWHAYHAPSRIGRVAAVDCASRIAMPCGGTMAEGWACYATDLMDEIGFLTPLERYAERHSRLRMAGRALVDVRLHSGTFSIEDAVAFYRDRIGMAPGASRGEAVKNSMFPGMALMYLMGCDRIRALRRELSALDPTFTLRAFHDRFLSHGSIPVALTAKAMLEDARRATQPA